MRPLGLLIRVGLLVCIGEENSSFLTIELFSGTTIQEKTPDNSSQPIGKFRRELGFGETVEFYVTVSRNASSIVYWITSEYLLPSHFCKRVVSMMYSPDM